jgi:hypothetical protein
MVQIETGERMFAARAGASTPAVNHAAQAAQRLVAGGAIMSLPEPRLEQHLVGHLEWVEPRRLFWFTAYGESLTDGHVLEFDAVHVADGQGVYFSTSGNIVSYLTAIDQAKVDDPDDYRIAWQLWQEVVPLRRSLIEACCTALLRGPGLVDGVDGQPWPARPGGTAVTTTSRVRRT